MKIKEFLEIVDPRIDEFKFKNQVKVTDLKSLCKQMVLIQIPDNVLKELDFKNREKEFDEIFASFEPGKILKNGQYLSQLNRVLDYFTPTKLSPYKKITMVVGLTARSLARFETLDDFKKEIYLKNANNDEKETFDFLNTFHNEYSLPGMFFNKACLFFSMTGILDVPYLNDKIKSVLRENLQVSEENLVCFHTVRKLADELSITNYQMSQFLEKYTPNA